MKKIIFVSTNNTCRSFIAESVLRKYLKRRSAGASRWSPRDSSYSSGAGTHKSSRSGQEEQDEEIIDFKASQLTQEDVETSDLILTMNDKQKEKVLEDYHGYKEVATINEYANDEGAVIDPYGMDDEDYEHCFLQITQLIHKIWNHKLGGNEMIGIGSNDGGYQLKRAVLLSTWRRKGTQ